MAKIQGSDKRVVESREGKWERGVVVRVKVEMEGKSSRAVEDWKVSDNLYSTASSRVELNVGAQ